MAILNTSFYDSEKDKIRPVNPEAEKVYERIQKNGNTVTLEDDWDDVVHLSPLRQNILCWYPFKKGCEILEIGENFGELTGMLAQKAKTVRVCENSLLRAKAVFERWVKVDNIEVIAADFRKIPSEMNFDYIIMNGSLENAADIIGYEDNPYFRMLTEAKHYLKENGILLLSVNNRLGIRYFSGAPEEHLGESFAGIEGRWNENRSRTFDRKEISDLVRNAGLTIQRWFYPFPDYKFTKEIFTDKSLGQMIPNFAEEISDKERLVLFSEQKVQRSFAENQIAPYFCNSFLLEITKEKNKNVQDGYDYIKLSTDRDQRFKIFTVLDYSAKQVYKIPCSEDAETHLKKMCSFAINEGKIRTLKYQWDGTKAVCKLLDSETLLKKLESYAEKADQEGYWKILEELKESLYAWKGSVEEYSQEFEDVFGNQKVGEELKWVKGLPFDCMAGNIHIEEGQWTLIDFEWLFDCSIPIEYILWRVIYQLKMYSSMHGMFEETKTNQFIGINKETEDVFMDWEDHFERDYVKVMTTQRNGKKRVCIEEMQNRLGRMTEEIKELITEKDRLSKEAQVTQEELKSQIQKQSNEIIALNDDRKKLSENSQAVQEELKAQIQKQSDEIIALNDDKKKLSENSQAVQEELKAQIQKQSDEIIMLNNDKKILSENSQAVQEELKTQIQKQSNEIIALNNDKKKLSEDAQIMRKELELQIQKQSHEITALNDDKKKLTEEAQVMQEEMNTLNQQLYGEIDVLKNERKEINLQKKKVENDLRMAEESLREIRESGMYRFSLKYYKVRDWLLPERSRRQSIVKAVVRKLKGEKADGLSAGPFGNQIEHLLNYGKMERIGIITTRHTMYVAKLFEKELERLSIEAFICTEEPKEYQDILYIIICPQFIKQFPELYISVQMEQTVSSRWFNDDYFVKLQNSCAIFDYSLENIDFYQQGKYRDIYSRVYYLPIDYYPNFAPTEKETKKEYDVVFYGDAKSCERRRNILTELSKEFKVKICSEVFGEDVYEEIRKAKVLVNIHYYEGALLETTRLYETLSLNTCMIISEDSKDKGERARLEALIDFAEIGNVNELKEKIRYWVTHDQERLNKISENKKILDERSNAFTFFFQRFMLACDQIDFNRFYKISGDYVQLSSSRICLSLPESTVRRRSFDSSNQYDFVCFPGLRHYKGWVGCGLSYKMIFTKAHEAGMKQIMICEDDVIFPTDFSSQIDRILSFLRTRPRWSVFSGLIADVGKVSAVTEREEVGDASILKIDHMVSTVFNIYNKEVFRYFMKWNEKERDVHKNAIDRYLENKDLIIYVRVPFLVGHDEELDSSVWGFSNVAYIDWIRNSEDKLMAMAEEFSAKKSH